MNKYSFPVIDPVATGENILRLRRERGLTVKDLQSYFGFEEPQAIYKWQRGKSLPSLDNLYALSSLLETPMDKILISKDERQISVCRSHFILSENSFGLRQFSVCRLKTEVRLDIAHSEVKNKIVMIEM